MILTSLDTEPPKGAPPKVVNPWIVAISVMFATFMEVLDTTVVNVSLPHIAGSLSSSINEATWVLTSYLVANAIILPITGWLANHIGRKRLLMISVVGFTTASFFCGFAFSLPMLIVFRLIQGTAGGALQPLSQAVLLEAFPTEKRGQAMAFWGLGIVVAPILGPVLGGWLTDSYSWRWVFYINIPVGVASIIMTKLFIFDPHYIRRREGGIDYWGLGMLALGIGALQIVLDRGQQEDWLDSPWILSLVVVTFVALVLFVFHEFRTRAPVVNLRAFRDRTFAMGTFFMTILGFVLYGSLVLLPLLLQTLLGYPSLQAGEAMAPRGLGSFLAMPIVGMLLAKYDPRKFLAAGLFIAALTLWQFSRLNLNAGYWDFFWPQLIQGVSIAFIFVPLTTITMGSIPKEHMGNATSIFNLLRNLGGGFGIAGVATLLDRFQQTHLNHLVSHINPYGSQAIQAWEGATGRMWLHGVPLATARRQGYAAMWGAMQRQAAILSFLDIFRLLAVIFVILIPFVLIMKKPGKSSSPMASH